MAAVAPQQARMSPICRTPSPLFRIENAWTTSWVGSRKPKSQWGSGQKIAGVREAPLQTAQPRDSPTASRRAYRIGRPSSITYRTTAWTRVCESAMHTVVRHCDPVSVDVAELGLGDAHQRPECGIY
jgi:hypothetical protein